MKAHRDSGRPGLLVGPPLTRRQALASIGLGLLGLTLAGCARQEAADQPPPIRYGEDVCTACNMIINEAAHASAYRTTEGEVRLFDDLGEMAAYHRQQREPVQAFFVHHYETQEWLRAETAFFVATRTLRTPMGYGIAAVASEPEAQVLAQRLDGKAVSFPDFLEQLDLNGRMGGMGGRHGR